MSYNIDGKVANQRPSLKLSGHALCGKCRKMIDSPKYAVLNDHNNKKVYTLFSYLESEYYIHETKSGRAVVYCSKYCMHKHNHRYSK